MQQLAQTVSDLVVALIKLHFELILLFLEDIKLALKRINARCVGRESSGDNFHNLASCGRGLAVVFGFDLVVAAFRFALWIGSRYWRKQDLMDGAVDLNSKLLRCWRHLES